MITTYKDIWNLAIQKMKERYVMPDILEYYMYPPFDAPLTCDTEDFVVPMASLDYGGSEGIYLDLYVKTETCLKNVGTFKTLEDTPNAMVIMSVIYGHYVNAFYEVLNELAKKSKN